MGEKCILSGAVNLARVAANVGTTATFKITDANTLLTEDNVKLKKKTFK